MRKLLIRVLCCPIRIYQVCISPLFPPCCRYYPSCSNYALGSIKKHGPIKGSYFTIRRIIRCNSLFPGGYDPVP